MNFANILDSYDLYKELIGGIKNTPISVSGIEPSAQAHLVYSLQNNIKKNALVICYSDMEARAFCDMLKNYTEEAHYFPSKEYVFHNIETIARNNQNQRLKVAARLLGEESTIVVAGLDAILQYCADREELLNNTIDFEIGKEFDINELIGQLVIMGYSREELVEGVGQFALRGGILDIYPPDGEYPVRIEFFDNETDSIRSFDAYSQRSLNNLDSVSIMPVREILLDDTKKESLIAEIEKRIAKSKNEYFEEISNSDIEDLREKRYFPSLDKYVAVLYKRLPSILDYFAEDDLVFVTDPQRISDRNKTFEWESCEIITDLKNKGIMSNEEDELYLSFDEYLKRICSKKVVALEILTHTANVFKYKDLISFQTKSTVSFHGKIDYLFESLKDWVKNNYTVVILANTRGRGENLAGILNDRGIRCRYLYDEQEFKPGEVVVTRGNLKKGFEYPGIKFVLVSENEIFEQKRSRERRRRDNAQRIRSYNDISVGDYVVHPAHGIGEYMGTQRMVVGGVAKDYLKLQYKGTDCLYIPVDQLGELYKYSSNSADKVVKLNRLGGQEWNKTKAKVKASTDELARELVRLYASRETVEGYAFSADTPWQRDFEDTFAYQETEDQLRSVEEVKADMEKNRPMDRLLCGDVGFGKTEIALRAAFKAVNDSKQVAYLCPTTILAMQHYETFLERMKNFPVKVEMLSRFRTATQQKKIIKKLKTGEIDVIIGTHRLLSSDIEFKDLGLLIIDEEQRFGVKHKERLKELKSNIDVLTMTATPIPRTLHMAMTSVRDMSVLTEPPQNRYPVQTYVLENRPEILIDAIKKEISRGGQVFYLHNKTRDIYRKAEFIKAMIPDINVAVGHGKMREDELEEIMCDMVEGKIDVLVCTTIIETGLDIPNANTIIIENADKMGLAQLYQLRGRVGRSNKAAYAYLTYERDKILSEIAQKRLRAIKDFTEFGSGFKIAMRDLEIRGAGNLLGAEQHGHMDSVGYDMYCKILSESVDEAKGIKKADEKPVTIDISVNAYLPENYIQSSNQRIDMYKKIAAIDCEEDKFEIEDELIDRYGDMPRVVRNIVEVACVKYKAKEKGLYEIIQKEKTITLHFCDDCLNLDVISALEKAYPNRIKIMSQTDPIVRFTMKEEPKSILALVNEIIEKIPEKKSSSC